MNINWSKVQTNVVSAVVVALVLGACAIVWRGATSVDDKVEQGLYEVKMAQKAIGETQSVLGPKVDRLEAKVEELIKLIKEQDQSAARIHAKNLLPLRGPYEPHTPSEQIIQAKVRDWSKKRD